MGTTANTPNCCDQIIAKGCLSNGNEFILADHGDGTYTLYDVFTGLEADPLDVVDCPPDDIITTFQDHFLATLWSTQSQISPQGTLLHWRVKCITQPVTININGVAFAMDLDEDLSSTAQDDRRLNDTVFVTISGAGRAHITTSRKGAS